MSKLAVMLVEPVLLSVTSCSSFASRAVVLRPLALLVVWK
jgi:hypothetical protein